MQPIDRHDRVDDHDRRLRTLGRIEWRRLDRRRRLDNRRRVFDDGRQDRRHVDNWGRRRLDNHGQRRIQRIFQRQRRRLRPSCQFGLGPRQEKIERQAYDAPRVAQHGHVSGKRTRLGDRHPRKVKVLLGAAGIQIAERRDAVAGQVGAQADRVAGRVDERVGAKRRKARREPWRRRPCIVGIAQLMLVKRRVDADIHDGQHVGGRRQEKVVNDPAGGCASGHFLKRHDATLPGQRQTAQRAAGDRGGQRRVDRRGARGLQSGIHRGQNGGRRDGRHNGRHRQIEAVVERVPRLRIEQRQVGHRAGQRKTERQIDRRSPIVHGQRPRKGARLSRG